MYSGHNVGASETRSYPRRNDVSYGEGETFLSRLAAIFSVGLEKADLASVSKAI